MNNSLTVCGHVGQSPKSLSFGDTGNRVAKFSVAVKEYGANKSESTLWIDVDAWNGLAERVEATVTKGREVVLTGRLTVSKYTKVADGKIVEIHKPVLKLSSFHLCGPKPVAAPAQEPMVAEAVAAAPVAKKMCKTIMD